MTTERTNGTRSGTLRQEQQQLLTEVGSTGLKQQGGVVFEEFLNELHGANGRRIYEEMRLNDPIVGGLLFAVEMPLRETRWFVEPQSDASGDEEAALFIESCMRDMSLTWSSFISQALTMLPFGWSYFEKVFKYREGDGQTVPSRFDDGKIGWRKFGLRAQDTLLRWEFDNRGGIQSMIQAAPPNWTQLSIPIDKALLFRTREDKGNPEGRSILRTAYRPWYFKKNLEQLEAIALERQGAGYPVVYMPSGWTRGDLNVAKNLVRKTRVDEQMGITLPGPKQSDAHPEGWLFEFAAPPNARGVGEAFHVAIGRYAKEMLVSVLASFISLGTDQVGSFALAKDHRSFFQIAIEGWALSVESVLNDYAVPQLLRLNGFNVKEIPQIKHSDIGQPDLAVIGEFISKGVMAGYLTPDDPLEDYLRELAGLPDRDESVTGPSEASKQPPPPVAPSVDDTGPSEDEIIEEAAKMAADIRRSSDIDEDRKTAATALVENMKKARDSRHETLGVAYSDWKP